MAQFKVSVFSTCVALRPGRHKTVTTPEITDQIHELILEDRWILAKSMAEQLYISRERVGSIIHEDLDMWKLSRSCSCTTMPGSMGTCNAEETILHGIPVSYLPTLFSVSGPVGIPPVRWTENTIEMSLFFFRRGCHCCRDDLVGRTIFWIFFEWLPKDRALG